MVDHVTLSTTPQPLRLRVADYLMLDEAGAFAQYGKTELLDGEIVYMNAQHRPHARAKLALYDALKAALSGAGSDLAVLVETTIAMPPHSAPEPDLVLTTEPDGEGPVPLRSVRLVIEVADSTLEGDLGAKLAIYAHNNVPEYWVVDLAGGMVHRMWMPDGAAYAERSLHRFGEAIAAATIEGLTLSASAIR